MSFSKSAQFRIILGTLVTGIALNNFFTINTLNFDHGDFRKDTVFLTLVNTPFNTAKEGDLVLLYNDPGFYAKDSQACKQMKKYFFATYELQSHKYIEKNGTFRYMIPNGFFLAKDPVHQQRMQCLAGIAGSLHIKLWSKSSS